MKSIRVLFVCVILLTPSLQAEVGHRIGRVARDSFFRFREAVRFPHLLHVQPEPYPTLPVPPGGWVKPGLLESKAADPKKYVGLQNPVFNPDNIEVTDQMTQHQQEVYTSEKVLTKLIQQEGGKGKDKALSGFGYYDPRMCADERAFANQDATANMQLGHTNWHQRAARAEGMPASAMGLSAENEAQSFADAPPPAPPSKEDPKYKEKPELYEPEFQAYLKTLEEHLAKHARSCIDSWKDSPGHYSAQVRPAYRFCYTMARSEQGKYYCIGLFTKSEFPDTLWRDKLLSSELYSTPKESR